MHEDDDDNDKKCSLTGDQTLSNVSTEHLYGRF